jgi:penicillin amidase
MINEMEKMGIEDFKRMVTDQHSDYAALLNPFILKLKNRLPEMSPLEAEAFNLLENWDYDMKGDEVPPTIFEFFTISFARNLLGDELDDLYNQLPGSIKDYYIYKTLKSGPDEWVNDITTSKNETLDDIILKSFKDEIKILAESYGNEISKWKWGSIHKIVLEHPMGSVKLLDRIFNLNSDAYGVGGSSHTVCPFTYTEGFKVFDGASERHIFNTADWDESYTVIPTGASGIPASEFYLSQTKTYIEGKFYKDAFSDEAVKAAVKYVLKLLPGK